MRVAALFGVLCLSAAHVAAEDLPELVAGTRVRVVYPLSGPRGFRGTLQTLDASTLTLQLDSRSQSVVVPLAQIRQLDVSEGRRRGKGAGVGAAIGLAFAGVVVLGAGVGCDDSECLCSGSGCVGIFGLAAVPLAAIGAVLGTAGAPEAWRSVPLPGARAPSAARIGRLGVTAGTARHGGLRLAASWSF